VAIQKNSVEIANLCAAVEKESVRVDTVSDRTPDDGKPMEDNRRLVGVLEKQLVENIENDGENDEGCETSRDNGTC
jgi:hypothetical protein